MTMKQQKIFVWTGGQPARDGEASRANAEALLPLPEPTPLRKAALIKYRWGAAEFTILASACSLRTTAWGGGQMTWLHCKAQQVEAVRPDEPTGLMTALIPAPYVTSVGPGPTFHLTRGSGNEDIGVFPPNQPAPAGALPLAEVERALAELLLVERN
jgi:hypothetical protein